MAISVQTSDTGLPIATIVDIRHYPSLEHKLARLTPESEHPTLIRAPDTQVTHATVMYHGSQQKTHPPAGNELLNPT